MAIVVIDGVERCAFYCAIQACDVCGEMALDKGRGAFCVEHPDSKVVVLRRETCTHGPDENGSRGGE